MPNLHIIVGGPNTRKSSMLRSLTGVSGGRNANQNMAVALLNGQVITVFCTTSALQESLNPMLPNAFINYVNQMNPIPTNVAITLRANQRGAYPGFFNYLQAFQQANWPIVNIALLGAAANATNPLPVAVNGVAQVPNSQNSPTNQTAAQVRTVWGWV